MQLIIGTICFLIFLFFLYLLGKDDYVLIKKNFLIEQLFDLAIVGTLGGLIISRILEIILHFINKESFILQFFDITGSGFILTEVVLGCMIAFYIIMKYHKYPKGHLFDFYALAFLSCLPFCYLFNIFFVKRNEIGYLLISGILYLLFQILFWKYLLKLVINNKLKEGSLSNMIFLLFSIISLAMSLIHKYVNKSFKFDPEDFILVSIFVCNLILLLWHERKGVAKLLEGETDSRD